MTAGDDGLAARALQNDEFGRMNRGEGACSRSTAQQSQTSHAVYLEKSLGTASQPSGSKLPRHKSP